MAGGTVYRAPLFLSAPITGNLAAFFQKKARSGWEIYHIRFIQA